MASPKVCEFFCHCSNMIWLKPAASTDIFDPEVESLPSPSPCFKSCYLSGLNTERKLRYFHPTKAATVRHPVPQWLSHQVGFQFKSFKSHPLASNLVICR